MIDFALQAVANDMKMTSLEKDEGYNDLTISKRIRRTIIGLNHGRTLPGTSASRTSNSCGLANYHQVDKLKVVFPI